MTAPQSIEIISRGILRQQGHILLCKNRKHGYHYLPGGHVEFGETAAAALAREFMEEGRIEVQVGPCLIAGEGCFHSGAAWHHEINIVFHVEPLPPKISGALSSLPEVASQESGIELVWLAEPLPPSLDVRPSWIRSYLFGLQSDAPPRMVPAWITDFHEDPPAAR